MVFIGVLKRPVVWFKAGTVMQVLTQNGPEGPFKL
jgi:hypothetical protein